MLITANITTAEVLLGNEPHLLQWSCSVASRVRLRLYWAAQRLKNKIINHRY